MARNVNYPLTRKAKKMQIKTTNPELLAMQEEFLQKAKMIQLGEMFADIGQLMYLVEKRDNFEEAIAAIRGKYIRKGRPYGWRKDKSKVQATQTPADGTSIAENMLAAKAG